jgi:hypothetical protein
MSNKIHKDELGRLLAEWEQLPRPQGGTAARVIQACRPVGRSPLSIGVRLALASLGFGLATGVVYAELVSLRHDDLTNSKMSSLYLRSIDPGFTQSGNR